MTTITVDEIQRDLFKYLQLVQAGETLTITLADQPLAEIKPVAQSVTQLRPFGLCAGEFTTPDDFDEPLPEEVVAQFVEP